MCLCLSIGEGWMDIRYVIQEAVGEFVCVKPR